MAQYSLAVKSVGINMSLHTVFHAIVAYFFKSYFATMKNRKSVKTLEYLVWECSGTFQADSVEQYTCFNLKSIDLHVCQDVYFFVIAKKKVPRELFKTISRKCACNARLWIDLFLLISVVIPPFPPKHSFGEIKLSYKRLRCIIISTPALEPASTQLNWSFEEWWKCVSQSIVPDAYWT